MREDIIEFLEKAFPHGCVIAWKCDKETTKSRARIFNPHDSQFIENLFKTLTKEHFKDDEGNIKNIG